MNDTPQHIAIMRQIDAIWKRLEAMGVTEILFTDTPCPGIETMEQAQATLALLDETLCQLAQPHGEA